MSKNKYEGIDPELVKIVKRTAQRAIGKAGLTKNDLPDIEQELMIAGIEGLKCLREESDTEKAFFSKIVGNRLRSILRDRHRKSKNWYGCCVSLNIIAKLGNGDSDELISLIDNEYFFRNNSCRWLDPYLDIDLVDALDDAIQKLPNNLRDFCEELRKKTLLEITDSKNISSKTAYQKIAGIREELEKQEIFFASSERFQKKKFQ